MCVSLGAARSQGGAINRNPAAVLSATSGVVVADSLVRTYKHTHPYIQTHAYTFKAGEMNTHAQSLSY